MHYSIIIPVYNEIKKIDRLLIEIESLQLNIHNEIIIIDDGSDDGTEKVLKKQKLINLIHLEKNSGKGIAIRKGLEIASKEKIIIFDGDMELYPRDILRLMILDNTKNINCVFGIRKGHLSFLYPSWSLGNYILTFIFNRINKSNFKDILCCAKAFYKNNININNLHSKGFDIDVELASLLIKNSGIINTIPINYTRRTKRGGKKLRFIDGWIIFKCIIKRIAD